jgi:hypothetical protein
VRSPGQREVKQALESAPGVVSVQPSGAALHLFLAPGKTSVDTLENALQERKLGPAVFRAIVPSLEDVFIALIQKSERS